jgi:hypothetical protein
LKKHTEYIVIAVAAFLFTLYHAIFTAIVVASSESYSFTFMYVLGVEWLAFVPPGLFMFFILWLSRRYPDFFVTLSFKTVMKHIGLALTLFVIHSFWQPFVNSVFFKIDYSLMGVFDDFVTFIEMRFLLYIIMVGLFAGLIKIREHEKVNSRTSRLKLELQKAKLKEIELKMNPEIIYPNLEFIRTKAEKSPSEASQMVILMAGLLRKLVDNMEEEKILLSDDIQFFRMYVDLVSLRLQRPIEVEVELERVSEQQKVPSMILVVPLLEELFFGEYQAHTEGFNKVCFCAVRYAADHYRIFIKLGELGEPEGLEKKLRLDPRVKQSNELLSGFEDEEYIYTPYVSDKVLELRLSVHKINPEVYA